MWIQPTLVFLALLFVLPGWAGYARPAGGNQAPMLNARHSKKQQENIDAMLRGIPTGAGGLPMKGKELLKQSGPIFIKNGQDVTNLDQIEALLAANKDALNQKVQQEQADIYQKHKDKIDSLKAEAQKLNPKPRKDEDGQLSIHDINDVFGMHNILTDGDIVPSPNDVAKSISGVVAGVSGVVSGVGSPLMHHRFQRAAPFRDSQYPATIWTNGVNWDFNSTLNQKGQDAVTAAIAFWQQTTCVRFNRVNAATAVPSMYPIVIFYPGPGCLSPVGRQANVDFQQVSIGPGCEIVPIAAHEIAHSLGVYHTQSRYDRDDNIYVDISNVQPNMAYSYDKQTTATNYNYGVAYDFRSVMHYGPDGFAIDTTKPTILTINPAFQQSIGAQELPTFDDIVMLNLHYSCYDRCNTSTTFCYYGGYPNPNNCNVCQCPNAFGGNDCSVPEPPTNGLTCGGQLSATSSWQVLSVTNQVGDGQNVIRNAVNPSMCAYHISAPAASTIQFSVNFVGYAGKNDSLCFNQCLYGFLSIKGLVSSWKPQGMRVCCPAQYNKLMTTTSNLLVIQPSNIFYYTDFSVQYKIA